MNWRKLLRPWCLLVGCSPRFKWDSRTRQGGLYCGVCGADQR